jgi:diapolycopene oxygenase
VLYLGLRKKYDHILHHNFVFSRDPHVEFGEIYGKGEPAADPTCYVCAPSLSGDARWLREMAKPCMSWFIRRIFENTTTGTMLPAYRNVIINKLKTTAGMEDIEDRIEVEHSLTPADIDRRYHVLNGAIYGLASHGRFMGAFKPANRVAEMKGLYLAGGSAHPWSRDAHGDDVRLDRSGYGRSGSARHQGRRL